MFWGNAGYATLYPIGRAKSPWIVEDVWGDGGFRAAGTLGYPSLLPQL